jgi:hypothetical protein
VIGQDGEAKEAVPAGVSAEPAPGTLLYTF